MKLTKKNDNHYVIKNLNYDNTIAVNQKLGQLEDIEEELGIDLITLFKAIKNGIYKKDEDLCFEATLRMHNGEYYLCQPYDDRLLHVVYLKDYGKTWALAKEELEHD